MTNREQKTMTQGERDEVLDAHYTSVRRKDDIDHLTKTLKKGITELSYENRGRGPHIGPKSIRELIWAIGRKANGF